ncbi:MAG: NAD(P)/FAD-dependent oxidoreductase [Bacteriovoracaceae bacterium]|jgi:monooxygenase|nr:NAD(P)/FAD-dependent oxidoreductase [Bacteriovoracaceae bacterium]
MNSNHKDVLIIGAGLSGINAAYQVQNKCPDHTYLVLEARERMGGTWDLFRYPGIRSDSDMYTLGFPFRPWLEDKVMADGPTILKYIEDTANEFGIDKNILYSHKIVSSSWSSVKQIWTVQVELVKENKIVEMTCNFLIMCSGYYDYDEGYAPKFPNINDFKGKFVHPQKWDEGLDYSDKNIVVIGSGATAITLIPSLAKKAKLVTMLQRSPSYIANIPQIDPAAGKLKKIFSKQVAHHLIRWKNILYSMYIFIFCRVFPNMAKKEILKKIQVTLDATPAQMKHFTPDYNPWSQRLCMVPDNDFFNVLKSKKAVIVTDHIASMTEDGIKLKSGELLKADIIVSATGLKIKFLAGIQISIDDEKINISKTTPYKASMLSGIPNFAMIFGYTNASWTLKCSLATEWIGKVLLHMKKNNLKTVRPEKHPQIKPASLINLSSGYIKRAEHLFPKQGQKQPWKINQNYILDILVYRIRPIRDKGLKFFK